MFEIYLMVNFVPGKHTSQYFILDTSRGAGAWQFTLDSIDRCCTTLKDCAAQDYQLQLETSVDTLEEVENCIEMLKLLNN